MPENPSKLFVKRQEKQKMFYDRRTRELPKLNVNDNVYIQKEKVWEPAVVVEKTDNSRSYIVKTENNKQYRRNRRHLMVNKNNVNFETDNLDDELESVPKSDVNIERAESNAITTRSGRIIKRPERLIEKI